MARAEIPFSEVAFALGQKQGHYFKFYIIEPFDTFQTVYFYINQMGIIL